MKAIQKICFLDFSCDNSLRLGMQFSFSSQLVFDETSFMCEMCGEERKRTSNRKEP